MARGEYCTSTNTLNSTAIYSINNNNKTQLQGQRKQQYQYNNNGKPNPDDVVLYLYTTYDSNSFDPIPSISSPIILEHPREFHDGYDIKKAAVMKLQTIIFTL